MKLETVFYSLGLLLIAAALALTLYNGHEDWQAGGAARQMLREFPDFRQSREENQEELPPYEVTPLVPMPVRAIQGREYVGQIEIPSLSLTLPVLNEWSYDNLNISPCRFTGSLYQGDMVVCGHNFQSHFGQLRNLRLGDSVLFTDMDGSEFLCTVAEITVLPSTAVDEMTAGQWPLTLFTCDRNRSNRLTIRCALAQSQ